MIHTDQPMMGKPVQIEIPMDKLQQLFVRGDLCAASFRCLNNRSKAVVWTLCLNACVGAPTAQLRSRGSR